MEKEIWKDILGYEGSYKISSFGNIFSIKSNKIMKLNDSSSNRYFSIYLRKNQKGKGYSVARLVAKAFIPNPDNKRIVDHIDGDKKNNHISNLRWATYIENGFNVKNQNIGTSQYKGVYFNQKIKKMDIRNSYW